MKELSWKTCLRLGLTACAVWLICAGGAIRAALMGAMTPLLMGGGVAFVVNIPMSALEKRLFPRGGRLARLICLLLSLTGVLAAAAWLIGAIVPELLRCVLQLAGELPELAGYLAGVLQNGSLLHKLQAAGLPDADLLAEHVLSLAARAAGNMLGSAADALASLTGGVANAILALVLAVYLLMGKEQWKRQMAVITRRLAGEAAQIRLGRALRVLSGACRVYVGGQCLEALLLGCLCLLGMALLRLPQVLMLSVLAGVSALIPLVGPLIAAAAGAAILLPGGTADAVTFAVFFLLLQQVESGFIYPRIARETLGLPPLWTLSALIVGGGLFGLGGALLAVPVAAAARTLLLKENMP